jgi:chromosomal replication initiator protein
MRPRDAFAAIESIPEDKRRSVQEQLAQALKLALSPDAYASWADGLRVVGSNRAAIVLAAQNGLRAEWLDMNARDVIELVLRAQFGPEAYAALVAEAALPTDAAVAAPGVDLTPVSTAATATSAGVGRLGAARMTFDRFCVDESNREAHALALEVARGSVRLLPMILIHGALGAGKTHLMTAVAMEALRIDPSRRVRYMYAQLFLEEFLDVVRHKKDPSSFKARVRENDLFLLDDVHRLAGKAVTEEELLVTIEHICAAGGQVMLAADHGRSGLQQLTARLRNHLAGAVDREVGSPSEELRRRILASWVDDFRALNAEFSLPDDVMDMIAHRHVAMRDMEGACRQLWTDFCISRQPVTLDAAERSLRTRGAQPERRITVNQIIRGVAAHYQMTQAQLLERTRRREIARPRQTAMYLATRLTTRSLPEIARCFSGVHHTTVLFARERIRSLIEKDPAFRQEVEAAERTVLERTADLRSAAA